MSKHIDSMFRLPQSAEKPHHPLLQLYRYRALPCNNLRSLSGKIIFSKVTSSKTFNSRKIQMMQGKSPSNRNRPVHKDSLFVLASGYCAKFLLFAFLGLFIVAALGSVLDATIVSNFLISAVLPLLEKLIGTAVLGIFLMSFLEGLLR